MTHPLTLPATHPPRSIYLLRGIARHWLMIFLIFFGVFNLLPFLAPIFMRLDWQPAGNTIYTLYSPLCHQMAQRSLFFFGPQMMYNADELPVELTGNQAADTLTLRRFRGNEDTGWKVAWSDRMVSIYGGVWIMGLAYTLLAHSHRMKPIPLWLFVLFLLPLIADGTTHLISDFDGLTQGFRYDNEWLAVVTRHLLPDRFYVGDAFGSFNSWMRWLTGLLMSFACVWLAFPYLDHQMRLLSETLSQKLQQWQAIQQQLAEEMGTLLARRN